MSQMHRLLGILMLLVVLASQTLGGAHAATHFGTDSGDCALCATFGNAAAALPTPSLPVLPIAPHMPVCSDRPQSGTATTVLCSQPRGPPRRITW